MTANLGKPHQLSFISSDNDLIRGEPPKTNAPYQRVKLCCILAGFGYVKHAPGYA
jgi:hypothetical protein